MRVFTTFEERNIGFLVNQGIDFTLVQTTSTGLKKSILDATSSMRTYFSEKGVHDYAGQKQGPQHKHLVPTVILDETGKYKTKTSLYRPVTKKGDPRLWIYGLGAHTAPDDIHAIFANDGELVVIDITRTNIVEAISSSICTPLKDFIEEQYTKRTSVADELLQFFRKQRGQWFQSEVTADTGIGRTIETMLGIHQNSKTTPDYKGIELKSHREKRTSNKNVLFTKAPDWELSAIKSSSRIVERYGYLDEKTQKLTYHNTVQCGRANSQALALSINQLEELLELQHHGEHIEDVATWSLRKLHERLLEKHRETFWIAVDNEYRNGKEYFRYRSIEHTKNPVLSQFDVLLESALITVDLLLCRSSGGGDTYSFKIKRRGMPLLFPESVTYQIM